MPVLEDLEGIGGHPRDEGRLVAGVDVAVPVPGGLLIPRATGTERVIQTMQSRVQRAPKDPAAYSSLVQACLQGSMHFFISP